MATMTTMTTSDQKSLYPDQVFTYTEVVPEALLLNPAVATIAGEIEGDKPMVRVPYIKTDPVATFVAEGAEIPDGGGMLDEVTLTTGKLALLIQRSNESTTFNMPSQLIAAGVSRAIVNQADAALLTNAKASNSEQQNGPVGLLNIDGLTALTSAATDIVDAVADAKATIGAKGATPTAVIVGYGMEAALRKLKDTTGKALLIDPTRSDALTLHGLPVIVNKAMPDKTLFVVAAAEIVAAAGPVKLNASDAAVFNRDSMQQRATWRIGYKPIHADRLVKITVTEAVGK